MTIGKRLEKTIEKQGYGAAAYVKVSDIVFEPTFRAMCDANACGKYGTSWVCPPGCESFNAMKEKVCAYTDGILVQNVYPLADSFDLEGMMAGQADFDRRFYAAIDTLNADGANGWDALKAGACSICKSCTYPEKPCVFPSRSKSSLEACGINVSSLCAKAGMSYINGKNTVTYFALFIF